MNQPLDEIDRVDDLERRLRNAHQATYDARRARDAALAQLRNQTALQSAADALLDAAMALPDVVRTPKIRRAIGRYRKARGR